MVIAYPHQRITSVGQADAARGFRQVDWAAIPIGKLERSRGHEHAIGMSIHANGRAELITQSPLEIVRVDSH